MNKSKALKSKSRTPRKQKPTKAEETTLPVKSQEVPTAQEVLFKSTISVEDDIAHIKVVAKPEEPELTLEERQIVLKDIYLSAVRMAFNNFIAEQAEVPVIREILIKILQRQQPESGVFIPAGTYMVQCFEVDFEPNANAIALASYEGLKETLGAKHDPLSFSNHLDIEIEALYKANGIDGSKSPLINGSQASSMDLEFYHIGVKEECYVNRSMDDIHYAKFWLVDENQYQAENLTRVMDRWYPRDRVEFKLKPISVVDMVYLLKDEPGFYPTIRILGELDEQSLKSFKGIAGLRVRSTAGLITLECMPGMVGWKYELAELFGQEQFADLQLEYVDNAETIAALTQQERRIRTLVGPENYHFLRCQVERGLDHLAREDIGGALSIFEVVRTSENVTSRMFLDANRKVFSDRIKAWRAIDSECNQGPDIDYTITTFSQDDFNTMLKNGVLVTKAFVEGVQIYTTSLKIGRELAKDYNSYRDAEHYVFAPGCYIKAYVSYFQHYSHYVQRANETKYVAVTVRIHSDYIDRVFIADARDSETASTWMKEQLNYFNIIGSSARIELSHEVRNYTYWKRVVNRIKRWL